MKEASHKLEKYINSPANYHLQFDKTIQRYQEEKDDHQKQDINRATFHNFETVKQSALEYLYKVNEERKKLGKSIDFQLLGMEFQIYGRKD